MLPSQISGHLRGGSSSSAGLQLAAILGHPHRCCHKRPDPTVVSKGLFKGGESKRQARARNAFATGRGWRVISSDNIPLVGMDGLQVLYTLDCSGFVGHSSRRRFGADLRELPTWLDPSRLFNSILAAISPNVPYRCVREIQRISHGWQCSCSQYRRRCLSTLCSAHVPYSE